MDLQTLSERETAVLRERSKVEATIEFYGYFSDLGAGTLLHELHQQYKDLTAEIMAIERNINDIYTEAIKAMLGGVERA